MPLLVLSLTGSAAKAGLVGVARTVAYPIVAPPVGVLADRVDRRRLMVVCALGRLVVIASVPVALALGRPPLSQLMLVALLDAALFATAQVAERGLVGEIVPREAYADAVALNEGRSAAAYTAGPPVGGALFGVSRSLPFVADAVSFLAILVSLLAMRVPPRARPAQTLALASGLRAVLAEAREGAVWLWTQPFLRAGALLYASANVTLGAVELLGLLIARHHGASAAAIGGAFALVGSGGVLGAMVAGPVRRRLSARGGVLAEPWSYAVFSPLLLLAHAPLAIGLLLGVMIVPVTVSSSIIGGLRLTLTPERLRSRVQASASFLGGSISWLGPLAVGVLFQYAGESATVICLSVWALVIAVAATSSPGLRRGAES